ncbi:hypothetical protein IAU60_006879 [Kwoniella sp. DSM 27419]
MVNGRMTGGGRLPSQRAPTLAQLAEENKALHRRINAQEQTIRSLLSKYEAKESEASSGTVPSRAASQEAEAELDKGDYLSTLCNFMANPTIPVLQTICILPMVAHAFDLLSIGRMAAVFRDFNQSFSTKQTLSAKFKCVQEHDARLMSILDDMPDLQPRDEVYHPAQYDSFDYRPWSRFLWSTSLPPSRIMLYRWFLRKSYNDGRWTQARERESLRREIIEVIDFFRTLSATSAIVNRGITLLEGMLGEADAQMSDVTELEAWPLDADIFSMFFQSELS